MSWPLPVVSEPGTPASEWSASRGETLSVTFVSFIMDSASTGAGKWTHRISEEFSRRGHHVSLMFRDDFPMSSRLGRWATLVFPMVLAANLLRRGAPRAVFVIHEPSGFWFGLARRLRLASTPMVVMSHGVESRVFRDLLQAEKAGWVPPEPTRRWKTPLTRLWQSDWSLRWADHCVCLSQRDAKYLEGQLGLPSSRITWTPNAGDVTQPPVQEEIYDVLVLGSWIPEKGSYVLPRIWDRVLIARPNSRMLLAGTGVRREAVLDAFAPQARSGIEVVESFEGIEQLARLLGSARIFLLPSLREGSPLGLLEAMTAGRAIVASRVGGVDDVLEDEKSGLIFDCGNWDEAAMKVLRLLDDSRLRAVLGESARLVSSGLTWTRTAAAVERACYAAMGRSR